MLLARGFLTSGSRDSVCCDVFTLVWTIQVDHIDFISSNQRHVLPHVGVDVGDDCLGVEVFQFETYGNAAHDLLLCVAALVGKSGRAQCFVTSVATQGMDLQAIVTSLPWTMIALPVILSLSESH